MAAGKLQPLRRVASPQSVESSVATASSVPTSSAPQPASRKNSVATARIPRLPAPRRGPPRVASQLRNAVEQRRATGVPGFLEHARPLGPTSRNSAVRSGKQRVARERTRALLARSSDCGISRLLRLIATRRKSSASSIVSTPSARAFSNLLPASSPTTTKLVFFDTPLVTRPPFASTSAVACRVKRRQCARDDDRHPFQRTTHCRSAARRASARARQPSISSLAHCSSRKDEATGRSCRRCHGRPRMSSAVALTIASRVPKCVAISLPRSGRRARSRARTGA